MIELRVQGANFGGVIGLSPNRTEDPSGVLHNTTSFEAESGGRPAVVGFTAEGASHRHLKDLMSQLNALPVVALDSTDRGYAPFPGITTLRDAAAAGQVPSPGRPGQLRSTMTTEDDDPDVVYPAVDYTLDNFENAYPSMVLGILANTETVGPNSEGYGNYRLGFAWDYVPEMGILHHTQLWPDDWGLELGPTLFNSALSGWQRPLCGFDGGDSDTDYFLETWNASSDEDGFFVAWNVPSEAEPYVDNEITFDPCDQNSLEIGIGQPRELENNLLYFVTAYIKEGTEDSSAVSAAMSAKTNDCNNLALPAMTTCMGLNTNAEPEYMVGSETLLNIDRGRSAPLMFQSADYFDQPYIIEPFDCPGAYCYE